MALELNVELWREAGDFVRETLQADTTALVQHLVDMLDDASCLVALVALGCGDIIGGHVGEDGKQDAV